MPDQMEDIMMNAKWTAAALAASVIALTTPAVSAPVLSSASVLKQSVASDVQQVQWRGHRHGHGYHRGAAAAGIGFAAGALVGSAIASSHRGYYNDGYGGAYAYDPGYAGYYAEPAPRYYNRGVNDYCARVDSSGVNRFDNCY